MVTLWATFGKIWATLIVTSDYRYVGMSHLTLLCKCIFKKSNITSIWDLADYMCC